MSPSVSLCSTPIGSDTTSFFDGHGKRTACAAWENFPDVTGAFLVLASAPSAISVASLSTIERYVILIYDRTSHLNKVPVYVKEWILTTFLRECLLLLFLTCFRSTMPESNCLQRKGEGWKDFHPPTMLLSNT